MLEDKKVAKITEEDLEKVSGGTTWHVECTYCGYMPHGDGNYPSYYYAVLSKSAFDKSPCPGCGQTYKYEITTIEEDQ